MGTNTRIEWCDFTINPVVGCSHCSPGCKSCYAEQFASRLAKNPRTADKYVGITENGNWTGRIGTDLACLNRLPKKPARIFVGSMCDLFHDDVPYHVIDRIVAEAWLNPQHTFIFLTKRPGNMLRYFTQKRVEVWCAYRFNHKTQDIIYEKLLDENHSFFMREAKGWNEVNRPLPHSVWPLPNLWLGATVCNQEEADTKILELLDIPANKRFISVEPMLGPVNLWRFFPAGSCPEPPQISLGLERVSLNPDYENGLHWVICGGETGTDARPMNPEWAKSLRDQCLSAHVPFFFKSYGEWYDDVDQFAYMPEPEEHIFRRGTPSHISVYRIGKKRAGRLLDGVEYSQLPEDA